MKDILVYTFRTFPAMEELDRQFPRVEVLHQLKKDLQRLKEEIIETQPQWVIGIAKADNGQSRFEPLTINQFNRNSKVIKGSKPEYSLYVPENLVEPFVVAKQPTHSFCNYSMFHLAFFLERSDLDSRLSFVHIEPGDIPELVGMIRR